MSATQVLDAATGNLIEAQLLDRMEVQDQPMGCEWVRRMAELEDSGGGVSVGGLAQDLGLLKVP